MEVGDSAIVAKALLCASHAVGLMSLLGSVALDALLHLHEGLVPR